MDAVDFFRTIWKSTGSSGCQRCCFMLLLSLSLAGVSQSDLQVFPKVIEVGKLVNLTCTNTTILCPQGNVSLRTSSTTGGESETINKVQAADQVQFIVRIIRPHKLYYSCFCNDGSLEGLAIGLSYVRSGFLPAQATNFKCYSPSWEEIICTWKPEVNRELKIRWNVTYTAYIENSTTIAWGLTETLANKSCDVDEKKPQCRIKSGNSLKFKIYVFKVVATNEVGKSQATFKIFNNESIVKLQPVSDFSVNDINSSSARLSWFAGNKNHSSAVEYLIHQPGLEYSVTYYNHQRHTKKLEKQHKVAVFRTVNGSMTLANLRPYTLYNATIRSKVNEMGLLWSEPVSITFRTDEAAPTAAPGVHGGCGFSFVDTMECNERGYGVTLYWKGIPGVSGLGNGEISRYIVSHNDKQVSVAEGIARETSFCTSEHAGHTYKLGGANVAGEGRQRSRIYVTSHSKAAALRIRPCEISATKVNETSVEISWELRSHTPSSNINSDDSGHDWGDDNYLKLHHYVIFWCRSEGRSFCTDDIQWSHVIEPRSLWPHNQSTGHFQLDLPGQADDFRIGISRYASTNMSGGISWAECLYAANGTKSKVPSPDVSSSEGGRYSVRVSGTHCTLGSAKTSKPVARVLYWCDQQPALSANSTTSCAEGNGTKACCHDGTIQSLKLDSCDYQGVIQGSAFWVQNIYPNDHFVNSSFVFVESRVHIDRYAAVHEGTWTSAMVGGAFVGVLSFLCVSATLTFFLKSYLQSSMSIKNIKKVPTVVEDILRNEQDHAYSSADSLYVSHEGKIMENKLADHGTPMENRSRDQVMARYDHGGKEGQIGNEEKLGFSMLSDDHGVIHETATSGQTWTSSREDGSSLSANGSSRDLSSARYIRAFIDDGVCMATARAGVKKLHVLNWLPIPGLSEASVQQEMTRTEACLASDYQNRVGSLCTEGREKLYMSARFGERDISARVRPISQGVSCPVMTSEDWSKQPSPSQTGDSSQTTASTACSSLDYWKAAPGGTPGCPAEPHVGSPLDALMLFCHSSEARPDSPVGAKRLQGNMHDESDYLTALASSGDRPRQSRLASTATNGKPNLDYI